MAGLKGILGVQELKNGEANLFRAIVAEFFAAMLLNFFGCGAVVTGNVVAIALAFGLVVAGGVQGIGHVSGGHINPAVTCGLLVIGKVPVIRGILYIIAQLIGAIAGSAVIRVLTPKTQHHLLGALSLQPGVDSVQGFAVEFFLALILVIVVCGACDSGKPESKGIAPLVIGFAVTLGHIVGIPRTGCGMNPARALGSAVVQDVLENIWLYLVGPVLGGMAGALIYVYVLGSAKEPEAPKPYSAVGGEEKELQRLTRKGQSA